MPKTSSDLSDDKVMRELDTLSPRIRLTPEQVAMCLGTTTATLAARRRDALPPPFKKTGAAVRYPVGGVRDFDDASPLFNNTAQARSVSQQRGLARGTVSCFLAEAKPADRWPFMVEKGRPVDFFHTLRAGVSDEARGEWLTVGEYARRLAAAVDAEALEEKAAPAAAEKKKRPPL